MESTIYHFRAIAFLAIFQTEHPVVRFCNFFYSLKWKLYKNYCSREHIPNTIILYIVKRFVYSFGRQKRVRGIQRIHMKSRSFRPIRKAKRKKGESFFLMNTTKLHPLPKIQFHVIVWLRKQQGSTNSKDGTVSRNILRFAFSRL